MKATIYIVHGSDEYGLIDAVPKYSFGAAKEKMDEIYKDRVSQAVTVESYDTYLGDWEAKILTAEGMVYLQIMKAEIDTDCLCGAENSKRQGGVEGCLLETYSQLSFIPLSQHDGSDFNNEPLENVVSVGADGTLTPAYKNQISIF